MIFFLFCAFRFLVVPVQEISLQRLDLFIHNILKISNHTINPAPEAEQMDSAFLFL